MVWKKTPPQNWISFNPKLDAKPPYSLPVEPAYKDAVYKDALLNIRTHSQNLMSHPKLFFAITYTFGPVYKDIASGSTVVPFACWPAPLWPPRDHRPWQGGSGPLTPKAVRVRWVSAPRAGGRQLSAPCKQRRKWALAPRPAQVGRDSEHSLAFRLEGSAVKLSTWISTCSTCTCRITIIERGQIAITLLPLAL